MTAGTARGEPGADDAPSGLVVRALGPLEARWRGDLLNLGGAKQQTVLALLLLDANRVVSTDRLLEGVWGEDAGSAATLQVYVSNLRRLLAPASEALGRTLIATQRPGYVLQLDDDQSDLLLLERLRSDGEAALVGDRPAAASSALRRALGLWRGEPFAGLPIDDIPALGRLDLVRLALREQVAEAELALGRHRELLDELPTWVAEHPLAEPLRGHLMLALYRSGRQAEALAAYADARRALVDELGLEPSRELRALEAAILGQDPALDHVPQRRSHIGPQASTAVRSSARRTEAYFDVGDRTVALDRPVITIGRLPDRDLVIDDPGVSRVHAEVQRVGDGFRLIDRGSANGTVVNGERRTDHVLVDGDVVRFGDVEIIFRSGG